MEVDLGGQPAKRSHFLRSYQTPGIKCDGDGFRVPTTYMKEELEGERERAADVTSWTVRSHVTRSPPPSSRASGHSVQPV